MAFYCTTIMVMFLTVLEATAQNVRQFGVAPKASHLRRRGLDFDPTVEKQALLFQDGSSVDTAARVHFTPKYPTLVLGDISDHIRDVLCTTSNMIVYFHTEDALNAATNSWNTTDDLVLISTHDTCATAGEYEAHLVQYLTSDLSSLAVNFRAKKQSFKEVIRRMSVDLGSHVLGHVESGVLRRSAPSSSPTPSMLPNDNQTASVPGTVSFTFQAPTATPTATKMNQDISFSSQNQSLLPPDQTILDLFPDTQSLEFVNVTCKNCSMTGSVTLEVAGFDIDSGMIGEVIDFFENGFFQFSTNGVAAHIELDVSLLPGFSVPLFTANLAKFPLGAIAIPGIITFGPILELTVPIGVTLNSPVNFTTGFELVVPDNSNIIMNFTNIGDSSQAGFDKTLFKNLLFTADADNLSLNLTAALKPKLTLSAGLGDAEIGLGVNGGVGVFMDLPKLVAQIDSVQNVNSTCNGPAAKGITNHAFRVTPSSTFDLGLHWELEMVLRTIEQTRDGEQVLASRSYPLPSQCIILDEKNSSAPGTSTGSSSQGSASASGVASSGTLSRIDTISGYLVLFSFTALAVVSF